MPPGGESISCESPTAINPTATQLALIPWWPSSLAIAVHKCCTPDLGMEDNPSVLIYLWIAAVVSAVIEPPPLSFKIGTTALRTW